MSSSPTCPRLPRAGDLPRQRRHVPGGEAVLEQSAPAAWLSALPCPGVCPRALRPRAGRRRAGLVRVPPSRRGRVPPGGTEIPGETGDTLFDRTSLRSRSLALTPRELVYRLTSGTASAKLAALWQIKKDGPSGAEQVDAVLSLLEERDEYLRTEAAWVVGRPRPGPRPFAGLAARRLRSRDGADSRHGGLGWASSPRRPRRPFHG